MGEIVIIFRLNVCLESSTNLLILAIAVKKGIIKLYFTNLNLNIKSKFAEIDKKGF